eukprot:scaffold2117_cov141-Skeletonema_menzelii.AAC.10
MEQVATVLPSSRTISSGSGNSTSNHHHHNRATFNSVRDTLGNLRHRLTVYHQRHSHNNSINNNISTDNNNNNNNPPTLNNHHNNRRSILQQLSDRLSLLDAAHSSRVPLQVMMMRRNTTTVPVVTTTTTTTAAADAVSMRVLEGNDGQVGEENYATVRGQDQDDDGNDAVPMVSSTTTTDAVPIAPSSSPPPPPPRPSLSVTIFSVSTRELTNDEVGHHRHTLHRISSTITTTSITTTRSTSSAAEETATTTLDGTNPPNIASSSSSRQRRSSSSVLFASRNRAHQSVSEGTTNILLASGGSSTTSMNNHHGGGGSRSSLNMTSNNNSSSSWYGFGDMGGSSSNRTITSYNHDNNNNNNNNNNMNNNSSSIAERRSSRSNNHNIAKRRSSTDLNMHLHPSISQKKLSTISDGSSKPKSVMEDEEDDIVVEDQDEVMEDYIEETPLPTDEEKPVTNVLYSWGEGIQSFHDDGNDRSILLDSSSSGDTTVAKVSSRLESKSILAIATSQNHSVCVTAQGTTYVVGTNLHGCVDPNLAELASCYRPQLLESLSSVRVVQVSCGYDHTAVLSSNGSVWTWGSNTNGQLGHRINTKMNSTDDKPFEGPTRCRPTGMALGKGRRASVVACGTHYTLVLTTHMSLLACGKPLIAGHREPSEWGMPKQLPTLVGLPLVGVSAGDGHAVVITAHGTAFVWGENRHSCCGREYPAELTVPLAMKLPSSQSLPVGGIDGLTIADELAIQDAACGLEHTILVTRSGRLLVCGNNSFGQLGIATSELESSKLLTPIDHPTSGRFTSVEAGCGHSLLLDDAGDVWVTTQSGIKCILAGKSALAIAAGGNNSAVITAAPTGAKLLKRQFSMEEIEDPTSIVDAVDGMIGELEGGKGDQTNLSQEIARKSEELLRYPSYLNSLFVNPKQLDTMFERLLRVCSADAMQELARAFERGLKGGLDSLRDTRLIHPEAVRCLLQYILFFDIRRDESIVFDLHGETISTFCDTILSLPFEGYKALHTFATSHYPGALFVKMLVKPLLRTLNVCASHTVDENAVEHFTPSRQAVPVIVAVLSWLYAMAEEQDLAKPADFYSDAVSEISVETLFGDLYAMKRASPHERSKHFYITQHPFLLSPGCKRNLLQMESQLSQYKAMIGDLQLSESTMNITVEPFFNLEIERDSLVEQTLECIKQADPKDIRKRLKVSFKGEEGLDAGGVTKEFFQLLSEELFDINSGLWSSKYGDEVNWFNSDNTWDEKGYEMIGVLFGLALYNNVLLDVRFPMAVYRKLLGLPLGLEDIVDAELRRGLKQLLDYEGDDVEDIFCLSFEVTWMELGEERRLDLKPDGANISVTKDNREEYVLRYVSWILVDSIKSQWEAFESGVMRIMEDASLDLFLPEELELLVVGSGELDFKALESNTTYEGGYTAESEVIKNFWRFVNDASKETQVQLLKFATASTKAPIGGLGKMPFIIQRAGPDSSLLPTSHTCFNTLLLPDYGSDYDKLANNLGRAVLECEGFGLE